jgi:hypothetical protein
VLKSALEMGISLHRGPAENHGEGVHLLGTLIVKGGLWKQSISLYGSSVRRTWNRDTLTGDPEGYVEEVSGYGHLFQ